MSDMQTISTTDTNAAAFLAAEGLLFLHVDATETRARFVFRDSLRGGGEKLLFAFYRNRLLRELLAQRKLLRRAVDLPRDAPSRTCTRAQLETREAARGPFQRERQHEPTTPQSR